MKETLLVSVTTRMLNSQNKVKRCKMWQSRFCTSVLLFTIIGVSPAQDAEAPYTNPTVLTRPAMEIEATDINASENLDIQTNGPGAGDCLEALPKVDGNVVSYSWDDFYLSATDVEQCVTLKEVPYTGYFKLYVWAGYSPDFIANQDQEEYRIAINDPADWGPIIRDRTDDIEPDTPKDDKDNYWLQIDHDLQHLQRGDNTIWFYKGNQTHPAGKHSVHIKGVVLMAPPHIEPEPEFTPNLSNTIKWLPIEEGAYIQEVYYFDDSPPATQQTKNLSLQAPPPDAYRTSVFSNLQDGRKYGYFVEAYIRETDTTLRSDTTYSTQDASPPGVVTIDSLCAYGNQRVQLFWNAVTDSISGVKVYHVMRSEDDGMQTNVELLDTLGVNDGCADSHYDFCYTDDITDPEAVNKIYKYRIDVMDNVGNISTGRESNVVLNIPEPELTIQPDPIPGDFYKGPRVTLDAVIADLNFPETHAVRFQAARDRTTFFEEQFKPNQYFFDSQWVSLQGSNQEYDFDLTADGALDLNFVNGHTYYFRAQVKDSWGNFSEWSDSLQAIPDCFPPDDVSSLTADPIVNKENTEGWIQLKWEGAVDHTSGIDSFWVYRKIENLDKTFVPIDTTSDTTYNDYFDIIDYNGDVTYRIGSVDKVGNARDSSATRYQVTVRSQTAPTVKLLTPEVTESRDVFYSLKLENFEEQEQLIVKAKVNGVEQVPPFDQDLNIYYIELPDLDGEYIIKFRVLFVDKSSSIWSEPDTIVYQPGGQGDAIVQNTKEAHISNYPNPFNLTTHISYVLEVPSAVKVEVYNLQGRLIRTLVDEYKQPGRHSVSWHGENSDSHIVSSGIYYYHIQYENQDGQRVNHVERMLLVK